MKEWHVKLDAYYEAVERAERGYQEAMAREALREDLKEGIFSRTLSDLYRFENEEHTLLASGLHGDSLVEREGIFLYERPLAEIGTLADVSELESKEELEALLMEKVSISNRCQNVDGAERELELDEAAHVECIDVLSETEVILRVRSGGELSLRSFSLSEGGLKPTGKLPEEAVHEQMTLFEGENGAQLLYFRNVEHGEHRMSGELYCYADGKETLLAGNAVGCYRTKDGGTVFLLTVDETAGGMAAALTLLDGEERIEVDDEVYPESLRVLEDGRMLYLRGDDLYIWENGESRCLRGDVSAFWVDGAQEYILFTPVI